MSDQASAKASTEPQVPGKCVQCRFLDKESDHMLEVTQVHLYCRAPWWHPKRWSCRLPAEVERG